jgi:hypothetical protein
VNFVVKIFRSSFWVLLAAILLTAGVVFAFSPAYAGKTPGLDSSLFMYIGAGINHGQVLYRDLWDNKPPLIFFLDAFGLRLAGDSANPLWGVWACELGAWLSSVVLLYVLLKKEMGRAGLLYALVIFVLNLPVIFGSGNMTETFALPCQLAGLYFYWRNEREGRHPWAAFCLGVAFALAFLLKQTTIGIWIALAVYVMINRLFAHKPVKVAVILWAAAGAAVVIGAVVAYFAARHALDYLWDVAFRFNYYYARASTASHVAAVFNLLTGWSLLSSIFPVSAVAWLAGLFYLRRAGWSKLPFLLQIALIDLPIECVLLGISPYAYSHYLVSMLPVLVILNGYLLHFLMQGLKARLRFPLGAVLYPLLLFLAVFQGAKTVAGLYGANQSKQVAAALEYIAEHSNSADGVLVWGYHPDVTFLSGRTSPGRFIHQIPLYTVGYATPQIFAELLADLQKTPPRLIIDSHTNQMPFMKVQSGRCVLPGGDLPQGMAEVFAYVCDHYHYDGKVGSAGWAAFTLDTSPSH